MKIPTFILALAGALLLTPCRAADPVQLPPKRDFHLFILAGQSNMAGRGKVDDEARKPLPRIFSLGKSGRWEPAVDPLHWDKPAAGVGIGRTFAEIVAAKNPGIAIGLVPTACGGSPISTWAPGKSWAQTKSNPYDDFLTRARQAREAGTLKAILWHQGESDSSPQDAPQYEARLTELIARMRTDLEAPDLPFIIGQLGRFDAKPWDSSKDMVDAAQRAVAKKVKNVRFVTAEGLTSGGDQVHFDTPSLRSFAKRYAEAFLQMRP